MLNRVLFALLLSLSMVSDALAEIKRVAVLEFRGVGIDAPVLLKLSDQSRTAAVEVLSSDEYLIMTRENMLQVLGDMGKDASCMDGQCEVEIGRNVGADLIVTGDVLQIEGTYVLTLKLYDTLSGGLLHSLDVEDTSVLALKSKTHSQSRSLFQKGLKLTPSIQASLTSTNTMQRTDSATVNGGDFSLDVVGQANQLAQQIAQLEKVIKDDLDQKEADIKAKASRQWNSADFVQLRQGSSQASIDTVERFIQAYTNVTVEYPQQVAIPISISLTRKVYIPETREAQEWLNDELVPQLDECNHNPSKCFNLGYAYETGTDGKSQDYKIAVRLYQFGCDGGNAVGCSNLGVMYDRGLGVSQDHGRALELYRQACDGGNAGGCTNLGVMYEHGKGVSQDYGRAVELYKQGCDDGYAGGCSNLGYMYRYGRGVSQNTSLARRYLRQGCNGGDQWGCDRLKEMD